MCNPFLWLTEATRSHASTVRSPVLYLTFEEDELNPHLAVVTRVLVSIRDASHFVALVCLHLLFYDTCARATAQDVAVLSALDGNCLINCKAGSHAGTP